MSAPSPLAGNPSLVTFTIKVEGKEIPGTFQVDSIDVSKAVNKVPRARLVLFDGSPAAATFPISDLALFLPGQAVSIAAGYESRESALFSGVIVKQGIEIARSGGSKLIVDLADRALGMTLERKNGLFEKVKDSDLIRQLLSRNGLGADVAATATVHEAVVQYYASDWDLMLVRAEMNGLLVSVEDGRVSVQPPDTRQVPVLAVTYGDSILELAAEMDATTQLAPSAVASATWDVATQKRIDSGPGSVDVREPGNVSSAELARVFGVKTFLQQTGGPIEPAALTAWSSAELLKARLAKIRGRVRFEGSAKVRVGDTLELAGLGARFNGVALVSGVRHSIRDGSWQTTAELGLSPRWYAAETPDLAAPGASGQLPPVAGLQTGVVKQVAKDPDGEHRVLVSLPLLPETGRGLWARLATFYAGSRHGAFFYPETGDEVIVGFMNQDPRYPVILGAVYSQKLAPPLAAEEPNNRKALATRSGLTLLFDDEGGIVEIRTPGKNVIRLDDKAGTITIEDGNRNQVALAKGGITLDSAADLKLGAKGNVSIEAGANLTLSAKAKASMKGLSVEHAAQTKFSARSNAAAEVTGSVSLTLRGAMVNIN